MKQLTRREWLISSTLLTISSRTLNADSTVAGYTYRLAKVGGPQATLPAGGYIPFDWAFGEITAHGEGIILTWSQVDISKNSQAKLRLTSATDVREDCVLAIKTTISGKLVAELDIRFAMYLQPFEVPIQAADLALILAEGVTLTMVKGSRPFWFFADDITGQAAPSAYLPHLMIYENPDQSSWRERLLSLESVQTFGWMEGCVLDGLHELSTKSPRAKTVLNQHLDLFFGRDSLVYANLNNQKAVGKINTVESILPFAILAQTNPNHPLLQTAIQFCQLHANADGVIADGTGTNRMIKTEECYTVSYPLAILSKLFNRSDLAHLAVQTIQARVQVLAKGHSIFQRAPELGIPVFENWSRGVAWYLLGMVKTIAHLPDNAQTQSLKRDLQNAVNNVMAWQQPNGLWYCFMHQPETGYETSGTAGIAAALSYGQARGLLSPAVQKVVVKARRGLSDYLTPDGYLTGTAQGNKGGATLQRNGFRVISPYTLGFLAHLETNNK